jgi:YihY family inner membrane protein
VNVFERAIRKLDRFQQSHRVGIVVAVVRKFGDDRCGALAAQLTYYGFVSLFPALLLFVTVLGFVMGARPSLEERIVTSALGEFPIIGEQLRDALREPLRGNGVALTIGIVGSAWGALGITQAAQHAMAEVWDVPGRLRPDFWKRLARGVTLLAGIGTGLVVTSILTGLRTGGLPTLVASALVLAATLLLNAALFYVAFRALTPRVVPHRRLVPGSIAAGIGWSVLQSIGGELVNHQLRHATEVYGFFGIVLGALSWLSLGAQLTLYCAELNVVLATRLWPRSIVQPPLTEADRRGLTAIAKREERVTHERVDVSFDNPLPGPEQGDDLPRATDRAEHGNTAGADQQTDDDQDDAEDDLALDDLDDAGDHEYGSNDK